MKLEEIAQKHLSKEQWELLYKIQSGEIDFDQILTHEWNNTQGTDTAYYNCPKCLNRGERSKVINGQIFTTPCDCMAIRRCNRLLAESGIAEQIKTKTFENYICTEPWQQTVKDKCIQYTQSPSKCLYLGGQSGAGKTHLCTAVCGYFIQQGKPLRYVLWRDIITKLQANVFNDTQYTAITEDLKNIDVLYIDDLFKLISTKSDSRTKELEIAFKILNDRELSNKITIISTEYTIAEIERFDEAIAGRIAKMCTKNYIVQIGKKAGRNYRLRDLEEV